MLKSAFASRFNFMILIGATLTLVLMVYGAPARVTAQDSHEARRTRAFELLKQGKFDEARELFDGLSKEDAQDAPVMFGLGFSTLATSKNIKDPDERRKARVRARQALVRAKELGLENDLLEAAIASIPPDGSEKSGMGFSKNSEADKAMQEGEALFTRGELDGAINAYTRAFKLDPQLYEAPLFIGDMYSRKKDVEKAGEWFAKAIAIDPDRETAYRYWGDVLMTVGRSTEARDKYVEAVVAAPYNRLTWEGGLIRWAKEAGVRLGNPKIEIPADVSSNKPGEVNITLDPKMFEGKDDGSSAWLLYSITRANWRSAKFAKTFPNEKSYRHSLAEEAEALRMVISTVKADKKIKKLDPSIATLIKLEDAGLLEAYILFSRADDGISQDYEAYRKNNRDKLRRYVGEVIAGKQEGKF